MADAAAADHHISALTVEHFKSFGPNVTIDLTPGLNVIVGPNGCGKSNLIDAISFALAQEPSVLRVRSWSELANRARKAPSAVRVVISTRSRSSAPSPALTLLAHAGNDQRVFRLGNAAATLQQAKEALLQVGFDASPSFAVRQHAAARLMDASGLTALLKEASGASTWSEAAATAQKTLSKERTTLVQVQADIAALDELRAKERAAKHALSEQLRLARCERRGREKLAELADCLRRVTMGVHEAALKGAHARLSNAQRAMAATGGGLGQAQTTLEDQRKHARTDAAAAAAASAAADRAGDAVAEAEAELVHSNVLATEAAVALAAAKCERQQSEDSSLERRLAACRLQGACRAARQAAAEADAASEEAAAAKRRVAAAASGGWFVEQLLSEARVRTEALLLDAEGTTPDPEAASRLAALRAATALTTSALEAETRRADELSSARWAAEQRARAEAENAGGVAESGPNLDAALQAAEVAAAETEDRRRHAELALARYEPSSTSAGTAPTLCSVLKLAEAPRLLRCLTALQVLAGPHLAVRLTRTREEAIPILEAARKRGDSVRVWPLSDLDVPRRGDAHERLQRQYGREDVIRPSELISSEVMEEAVLAAVGSTLIVSSDELASTLGREHGVRCVTIGGNVHEQGSLQGGHRDISKQPSFASLLERQEARAAATQHLSKLDELRSKRTLLRDVARSAAALTAAIADETKAKEAIDQLRERLEAERTELFAAVVGLGEQGARAVAASELADGLRGDLAMLRDAQAEGEQGTDVSRDRVLRTLTELAQRAAARADGARSKAAGIEEEATRCTDDPEHAPLDFEAEALLEQYKEHLAAQERAASMLRKAEGDQVRAGRVGQEAKRQAAASTQLEATARAAIRLSSEDLEAAKAAVRDAEAEVAALGREAAASIPEVATRWLVAEAGAAVDLDDEDSDMEVDEDDVTEDDVAGLTEDERRGDDAVGGDGEALSASLAARMHAGEMLLETWRRERHELLRVHGPTQELRVLLATCGGSAGGSSGDRLAELDELQRKAATVSSSSAAERLEPNAGVQEPLITSLPHFLAHCLPPSLPRARIAPAGSRAPHRRHRADEAARGTGQRRDSAQGARGHKGRLREPRTEPRARHHVRRAGDARRERCAIRRA